MEFEKEIIPLLSVIRACFENKFVNLENTELDNKTTNNLIKTLITEVYESLADNYKKDLTKKYFTPIGLTNFIVYNLLLLIKEKKM